MLSSVFSVLIFQDQSSHPCVAIDQSQSNKVMNVVQGAVMSSTIIRPSCWSKNVMDHFLVPKMSS